MEQGGFTLVKHKKKRHGSKKKCVYNLHEVQDDDIDTDKVKELILKSREELRDSSFYSELEEGLKNHTWKSIVCYGLGNFALCHIARYQLGLLLCLQLSFQTSKVEAYDPKFLEKESDLLHEFNITVIDRNEECKRVIKAPTLCYMPHCGKPMYNNLLWANWGPQLNTLTIYGNSFSGIIERCLSNDVSKYAKYISAILPYLTENPIANIFVRDDVFNNLSIHSFPEEKLVKMTDMMWCDHQEPSYGETDVEIILNPK